MALLVTLLAGAFFLVGAAVAWRAHGHEALEDYSVAVAFGSLGCVAVTDLVPEVLEIAEEMGWLPVIFMLVIGAVALILLDRAVPEHHAGEGNEGTAHIGLMTVLALSIHNLAEGAAIYVIASQDLAAGLGLALGVGLHNAPMGMLLYSAMNRGRTYGIATLAVATLSTFVGGLIMFALGGIIDEAVLECVVCVALGMILYILLAELLPTMVRSGTPLRSIIGAAIGIAFVLLGGLFE